MVAFNLTNVYLLQGHFLWPMTFKNFNYTKGVIKGMTFYGFRRLSTTYEEFPPIHSLNAFGYTTYYFVAAQIMCQLARLQNI